MLNVGHSEIFFSYREVSKPDVNISRLISKFNLLFIISQWGDRVIASGEFSTNQTNKHEALEIIACKYA